ncbi:hypothetical protein SUGI_1182920 [Cryptomeria japonica]|nr:hypothetical protein SUGI_1182920 [Cryptomeria japonica]
METEEAKPDSEFGEVKRVETVSEFAVLNDTLGDNEICHYFGESGHKQYLCPTRKIHHADNHHSGNGVHLPAESGDENDTSCVECLVPIDNEFCLVPDDVPIKLTPGNMELTLIVPNLEKLISLLRRRPYKEEGESEMRNSGDLYRWKDLLENIQASDEELKEDLGCMSAVEQRMLEPSNSKSSMSVVTHLKNVAILISKSGNDSVEFSRMEYIVTDSYGNGYDGLQSARETISALSDFLIIDENFENSPIGNGGKGQIQRGDNVEVCANDVETEGMMEPAKPLQYDCNRHEKSDSESYFWALAYLKAGENVTDFGSLVPETIGGLTYDLTYGDLLMIFSQHGLLAVFAQKGVMDCSNNRRKNALDGILWSTDTLFHVVPQYHFADMRLKDCLILASDGVWYIVSTDVACEVSYRCLVFHSRGRRNGNKVKSGESSPFGTKVDKHFNNSVKVKLVSENDVSAVPAYSKDSQGQGTKDVGMINGLGQPVIDGYLLLESITGPGGLNVQKARDVFDKTPEPNPFFRNTLIVDVVFGMVDMGKNVVNDTNAGDGLQVSPAQIVSEIPNVTNPDASITLDRILGVLANHSLLSCFVTTDKNGNSERLYGLTPLCKYLVQNKDGFSLAPLALMSQDKVFIDTWHYLKDAILEGGQPFTKAHGVNAFEYPV